MKLFSDTITTLENALSYSALKQRVIAQNIANADTPNYKAKSVSFKSVFQSTAGFEPEAKRTDPRHIPFAGRMQQHPGVVTIKTNYSYNHNGNGVDVDKEMADLAANQIYYNAVTDLLSGKFQTLHSVIKGGK